MRPRSALSPRNRRFCEYRAIDLVANPDTYQDARQVIEALCWLEMKR